MNVTAQLNVTAYGTTVYHNEFNPCDANTFISQLCPGTFDSLPKNSLYLLILEPVDFFILKYRPCNFTDSLPIVPSGSFSATGSQAIPAKYSSMIPSIAFSIPDIAAQATLELKALDSGDEVACITSKVTNGKTVNVPAVSYVAAGVAGTALLVTGFSSLGGAAAGGGAGASGGFGPSFTTTFGWFQGMAMNGMLSVNYPPIYRSFAKNFAFSTGIIPWTSMQTSIDNFRAATGGNLTDDSVQFLRNATEYGESSSSISIRALGGLVDRDISTNVNSSSTAAGPTNPGGQSTFSGMKAYFEELSVPQANTFMTVLLILAIVIAVIIVGILLFKLILELWAQRGSFPQRLAGFRNHYWGTMARTIVNLILAFYGSYLSTQLGGILRGCDPITEIIWWLSWFCR
jgi:hypothetical protein